MREDNFKVHISAGKVTVSVFWNSGGVLLVDVLEGGTTNRIMQRLKTVKKLKQIIQTVQPNRKVNQSLIFPTAPI